MGKIVLFGNGRVVINAHKYLASVGHQLLSVIDPDDTGLDSWKLSFGKFLKKQSADYFSPPSFKDSKFLFDLQSFNADIMLSLQCSQIISQDIINLVSGEIFNFHFADLPKNRGCHPVNWHIKNGDKYIGVTLHKLIAEFDAGNIIDKKIREIHFESLKKLYGWCEDAAIELLKENIDKLINKNYSELPQNIAQVVYYSRHSIDFSFPYINWNKTASDVARQIQALIFPPLNMPKTRIQNKEIEITEVVKIDLKKTKRTKIPGTVISLDDKIFEVQCIDGSIYIKINTEKEIETGDLFYL